MKKSWIVVLLLVLVLLLVTACAAGPNELADTAARAGHPAGFWLGVWHGFISPVTFIISLFNHNVGIYEVHNNGGWYNFGFMVGVTMILGGGGGGAGRRSKRG